MSALEQIYAAIEDEETCLALEEYEARVEDLVNTFSRVTLLSPHEVQVRAAIEGLRPEIKVGGRIEAARQADWDAARVRLAEKHPAWLSRFDEIRREGEGLSIRQAMEGLEQGFQTSRSQADYFILAAARDVPPLRSLDLSAVQFLLT